MEKKPIQSQKLAVHLSLVAILLSTELLLARLVTYFFTPGDNVLLCKMPLNISASICLHVKRFSGCGFRLLKFAPSEM